jgi:hypothetical protein
VAGADAVAERLSVADVMGETDADALELRDAIDADAD